MSPESDEAGGMFDEPDADPATMRLLKTLVSLAFAVAMLLPFGSDLIQEFKQRAYFGEKLDLTIASHPDRLRGEFVRSYEPIEAAVAKAAQDSGSTTGGAADSLEPLTFWARVDFAWKAFNKWLREPTSQGSRLQNEIIFGTLVGLFGFLAAVKVYGLGRVTGFISGLLGPDRLKKVIIDVFFMKGIEKEVFPAIRTSDTRKTVLATHTLNRVELHDLLRVTVGMQGGGSVECYRESMTLEGRAAYAFCGSATGSGGDYYFNMTKVLTRTVKLSGDMLISAASQKGHVGRLKFVITGFKAAAWE